MPGVASREEWVAARPLVAEVTRRLWARHGSDPNVVGMAFGPPIRGGRALDTPACIVHVVRKLPESELDSGQVIPRTVEVRGVAIETDVVQSGRFVARPAS
ncbi:hypothetical protein [Actinomadura geliboluensis]